MKIKKTKKQKQKEVESTFKENLDSIVELVESDEKVEIQYDRDDFKSDLSTTCGYGFQDMKKEHRLTIVELLKKYNVKFKPDPEATNVFGVLVTVKKK